MNVQPAISDLRKPQPARPWQSRVPTDLRLPVLGGTLVIVAFVAAFGLWAALAPLSRAVVAAGIVQASGQNLVIEHLEGGIVSEITVAEGDRVSAGDVMILLDDTRAIAERDRVTAALVAAEAGLARALAERDGRQALEFPSDLVTLAREQGFEGALDHERAEFENRRQRYLSEVAALDERIKAANEEIEGLRIERQAEQSKLEVTRQELADKQGLLDKGLVSRGGVNDLRRAEADYLGRVGSITSRIGQRGTAIAEIEQQRIGLEATRRESASTQINEAQARIADLRQQLRSRQDIVERSIIRAPLDGVVVKLDENTVGGVLKAGEPVAEILPTGAELIVDARIPPREIDNVRVGQSAVLRFVALNARTTPEVAARVTYVSADRLIDPATRDPYFTARLAIAPDLPPEIAPDQIYPGMPVDTFIATGERTFLEYLVEPIQDSFAKAFREE